MLQVPRQVELVVLHKYGASLLCYHSSQVPEVPYFVYGLAFDQWRSFSCLNFPLTSADVVYVFESGQMADVVR